MPDHHPEKYERKITPVERLFTKSPFSNVVVVVRIRGMVSEEMLRKAVSKAQQRHLNLRVRIREDESHTPWFTTEGVGDIPVEIIPRESADQWIAVHHEASKLPYEFEKRPAARFILIQSPDVSELLILCHHIICDGMSLAYLARDLMSYLGNPDQEIELLPDPAPVSIDTLPGEISINPIVKFFLKRFNKKWGEEKIFFDEEDYKEVNIAYWAAFNHRVISIELTEGQTSALVDRCRKEGVTVNSALTAAFSGAQVAVQGDRPYHAKIGVAANIRDYLRIPAGEVMGFYAGVANLNYKYNDRASFWENARKVHKKLKPLFNAKNLLSVFLLWCHLDPSILDALNFKKLGALVPPDSSRYQKLSAFSKKDDVVLSILKRDKMDSLDNMIMGTAITNLARLDFPGQYGSLELDRLIMQPGGAFPLATVNLVLGAATCSGKLSLIMEYAEEATDSATMAEIKNTAMAFLLDD